MTESEKPGKESCAISVMTLRNEPRKQDMAHSARSVTEPSLRDRHE
jgi:hypothetical protein